MDNSNKQSIYALDRAEWRKQLTDVQVKNLMHWLYKAGQDRPGHAPISGKKWKELEAKYAITTLSSLRRTVSEDGSVKTAFDIHGGQIESVWIVHQSRKTLCVSSQVGCALDCKFCMTAKLPFKKNLKAEEIIMQVLWHRIQHHTYPDNVVFMGMGEPFLNYDQVKKAVLNLSDDWGIGIGKSKITVSTAGVVPGIYAWADEVQSSLAVSLITADEDQRKSWMGIANKYSMNDLIAAMKYYNEKAKKKIFVEYILADGLTDSELQANLLAEKLRGLWVTVNLIPYNDNELIPEFKRPTLENILKFRNRLREKEIFTTVRWSHGGDVGAACGQLAGNYLNSESLSMSSIGQ